jgi:hypothetical protein
MTLGCCLLLDLIIPCLSLTMLMYAYLTCPTESGLASQHSFRGRRAVGKKKKVKEGGPVQTTRR